MLAEVRGRHPTPSCCCSRRTPTPTSRSGRSTTSGSTTTASSRGTRRRSGSTRSSTTCSTPGAATTPPETSEVRVVGHRWSDRSHEVKTFLTRNHVPYRWLDVERDEEARRLLDLAGGGPDDLPLVLVPDGAALRTPSHAPARRRARPADPRRAAALRPLHRRQRAGRPRRRGVCRVGGPLDGRRGARGPGRTGRPERRRSRTTWASPRASPVPTSPTGRWPRRPASAPRRCWPVTSWGSRPRGPVRAVRLDGRRRDRGPCAPRRHRCLLPAARGAGRRRSWARPRRLLRRLGERGRASATGEDVYVVGAANSAGQAVLNFARYAKRVVLLVRGRPARGHHVGSTSSTGSAPPTTSRCGFRTRGRRRRRRRTTSSRSPSPTGHRRDERGGGELAVRLHRRLAPHRLARRRGGARRQGLRGHRAGPPRSPTDARPGRWRGRRSRWRPASPGVFAAGDVRLDSMKRVASAVGEGAMSVYLVHRYLATI